MNAALVKIDVAANLLQRSAQRIFEMADGVSLIDGGLTWVFNLANDPKSLRRDLRFWLPELEAVSDGAIGTSRPTGLPDSIGGVVDMILPARVQNFQAGQIDALFQIRPRTRIDLHGEFAGSLRSGRNFYHRDDLAAFLKRRWLGASVKIGGAGSPLPAGCVAIGRQTLPSPTRPTTTKEAA